MSYAEQPVDYAWSPRGGHAKVLRYNEKTQNPGMKVVL
jgi:hypothetical protein